MALGGLAPLLVFQLYPLGVGALVSGLIPFIPADIANAVGLPIPIYLSERQTGIYVDTESRQIDMETQSQQLRTGAVQVDQRGVNNSVTIKLFGKTDSVLLTALLAMSDMLFAMAAAKSYKVSYFNGPTVVLSGLLHGFTSSSPSGTNLVEMTFVINKSNVSATLAAATTVAALAILPKVTAELPV